MVHLRRDFLKLAILSGTLPYVGFGTGLFAQPPERRTTRSAPRIEGQRRADQGNGSYLNPVFPGDNPDPSILKDGGTYFKVSSSFDYYPGLLVWASEDLINWRPVGPALRQVVGSVYAPDIAKHGGRYFIYFPSSNVGKYPKSIPRLSIYVVHAPSMSGPWSDPVDLGIHQIDPGHVVGEDRRRYLFLDGGLRVELTDDGLATRGAPQEAYKGWPIPPDWAVEGFALEGPKLLRRNGWFYMFSAEGGTAGPPTSHMLVVARSRSVHGPWENCPQNPIVHTRSAAEPWWSRGHATPVEGPRGDWWLLYHGYENGFRSLGRQALLEPMTWTADGWPRAMGGDLSRPLPKPVPASPATGGMPLSDDFAQDHLGTRFTAFAPVLDYPSRVQAGGGRLRIAARGTDPATGTIVTWNAGDRSYTVTAEIRLEGAASAGLLLFYSSRAYSGITASGTKVLQFNHGRSEAYVDSGPAAGQTMFLRVVNDAQTASFFISPDGASWRRVVSYDVTGINHNIFDQFLSLRPAIISIGEGAVEVRRFTYQASPQQNSR